MTKRNAIDILNRAERAGHTASVMLDASTRRGTWVVNIDRTRWISDYEDARAWLSHGEERDAD